MTMPPSGLKGQMDDQAAIEAQIQLELDNINLDAEDDDDLDVDIELVAELEGPSDDEFNIPGEIESYIKRIQDQSSRFEQELKECDELLDHTLITQDNTSTAILPYEDHSLLVQLAKEHNLNVDEYKRKVLADIENDNDIIVDELEGLIENEGEEIRVDPVSNDGSPVLQITQYGEGGEPAVLVPREDRLVREIEMAVQDGVVPDDAPVLQDMIPADRWKNGQPSLRADIQKMLKDQLDKLEQRYQERIDAIKKDEAFRRDEEELEEKRMTEERQYKREEQEREKRKVQLDQEMAERQLQKEIEEANKQMKEEIKQFEEEMATLQRETEQEKRQLEIERKEKNKRQIQKQNMAALMIQKMYKGHRVRKNVQPLLQEKTKERKDQKMAERIKEIEIEIQKREEEKEKKAEMERHKQEEERLKKEQEEEAKRQKELEKKQKEEEKRRQKEEEEKKKQEEKQRKEEEKRLKEEEKRLKKEEEKRRKEEEKKRKEEEEQRKKEEKRLKDEEEKRKKEEEKRLKEEEKKQKEEEKRQKEEEEKHRKEEEKRQQEEKQRLKEEEKRKQSDDSMGNTEKETSVKPTADNPVVINNLIEKPDESKLNSVKPSSSVNSHVKAFDNNQNNKMFEDKDADGITDKSIIQEKSINSTDSNRVETAERRPSTPNISSRPGTPKAGLIPHPPSPRKRQNDTKMGEGSKKEKVKKDILPEKLENLRLRFIKECLPWSKVSNEPWKLKAATTKKPLRRPSSAKKLTPLPEEVILQAGKVASLKMVTTVQLQDLPGHTLSPLGQCWGLRHLSMTNCNLIALDSLTHCRQLNYLDVQGNKIEFVDLKDLGNLQYLNLSENRLTSIHGLDSCTNLRWLDVSHNNITKLGGLSPLRRLHTLSVASNQLISLEGLEEVPTLQRLDISENHLQSLDYLHKLCLLLCLDASANNIQQIPRLSNHVLLQELVLNDNSISSLDPLVSSWLPMLSKLHLGSNSIETLPSLANCLLLRELDVSSNQLLDIGCLQTCVQGCVYLEHLHLEDNPVMEDLSDSFYDTLLQSCPRLLVPPPFKVPSHHNVQSVKPGTSFEAMCLSQSHTLRDLKIQLDNSLKSISIEDISQLCDAYFKYCEKSFNLAAEYRSAHEYGEVTVAMPMAPATPRSAGRPSSSRHKDKFINPKDMFEHALRSGDSTGPVSATNNTDKAARAFHIGNDHDLVGNGDLQAGDTESVVSKDVMEKPTARPVVKPIQQINPKDLFEQALRSANGQKDDSQGKRQGNKVTDSMVNGHSQEEKSSHELRNCAATSIQASWRGYSVRKQVHLERSNRSQKVDIYQDVDPNIMEYLHSSATRIQAQWRGYILRKKLLAALDYAQCDFEYEHDEDAMIFDEDFDLSKFVDIDEDLLDTDWKPPETPDIPASHPVLRKPPSGRPIVPPLNVDDLHPPSNPRRAWRPFDSPASGTGIMPRPPSSVASTNLTVRSQVSKKEEKLTEEWGFKDSNTAHLMMKRAKKMKYNAEKRKKLGKLDPKQRLALYRKLEEVTHPQIATVPFRKTLPRKEYFQARQDEMVRQDQEKHAEFHVRASRTYQWLHTQVGDHQTSDSIINQGTCEGPKYINTAANLPGLQSGQRIHLVSSPGSLDLQSVTSVSTAGQLEKPRRFSAGSGGASSKLPPIQNMSAPSSGNIKERMSFRNPKQKESVGWGGGRKRGQLF